MSSSTHSVGEITQFRSEFDDASLGVLSDILSTLYANPERSTMREYIANGIDAHVQAGVNRPVKVTLPSYGSPSLVVKDFGNGLPLEALRTTFFKYGASTKNDDDDQIGAFGIGAKSAFSLSKSWTVCNIHNGLKYVISTTNDSHGAPLQTVIVNGEPTTEQSGVTVTVPIAQNHLMHDWAASAKELAMWFPKNSVEFEGATFQITHWSDKYSTYHRLVKNADVHGYSRSFEIIMCGIMYTVDSLTTQEIKSRCVKEVKRVLGVIDPISREDDYASSSVHYAVGAVTKDWKSSSERHRALHRATSCEAVLNKWVDTIFRNAVTVDAGDVDLMPSRESVKGTPRTMTAVTDYVNGLIGTFANEISSFRELPMIERIAKAKELSTVCGESASSLLNSFGVPNIATNVRHGTEFLHLHFVISSGEKNGVLVTGVKADSALPRRRLMETATGCRFMTTSGNGADPLFGDLTRVMSGNEDFPPSITREEYRDKMRQVSPAKGGTGDTVKHSWAVFDYNPLTWEAVTTLNNDTFADIVDAVSEMDYPVYVVEEVGTHYSLAGCGVRAVVIRKGRRQLATFERELGVEVKSAEELCASKTSSEIARAFGFLERQNPQDIRCAVLSQYTPNTYISALTSIMDSSYGSLIRDDHRSRAFLNDIAKGKKLLEDPRMEKSIRCMRAEDEFGPTISSEHADIRSIIHATDTTPWKMLSAFRYEIPDNALCEAAVYLAAVG